MDQDAKPETSARPTGKHRPPWLTSLLLVLLPLVALIALLWGGGAWLTGTPSGLRALLTMAGWAVPSLSVSGVEGSVSNGFTIDRLVIDEPRWSLHATELALTPQEISVRRRLIDLGRLHARNVEVRWTSEPSKAPAQPPQSLALPFNLNLRDVRIAQLALGARGAEPTTLNDVALQLSADRNAIRVAHASARFGPTTIRASGHIDAASPFALEAHADLQTTVLEKPVQTSIDAGGQLANIALSATSDNDAARLSARAQATPFAAVPLAGLSLNIAQLELSQWLPQVPPMRLSGSADLQPRTIDNALALAGPFSVSNALAGPVDRQRIPLQSLRGTLTWSASLLNVAIDRAELAGGAASGTLTRRSDGRIQAQLRFNGIDATRIHTAAVKTQIAGALDYALADGVQSFQGKATNARGLDLGAEFALKLANSVLDVERAHLRIGDGRADVSGRVTLGQAPAAQLRGQFAALDLSQFFKGFDTRLNGRLTVDGTLGEPRRGHAEIELADSRIAGRALQGNADIKVNGDLLDVATDVRSGAAHLTAQGGLGKGRELTFELNAPNLGELASTLAGSVQAQGTVSGSLQQPSIVASATASNLTLPSNQHIDRAEAHVRASAAADAKLDVELTVNGHRVPDKPAMSLTKASLTTRGTTSAHTIALDATTAMEQPVRLRAAGGWNGKAWQGRINEAVVGKPLDLHLDRPAPVTLSPERVALGPTAFTARETHFTDVDFERVDGHWQSSGVFTELQPQALDPRARARRVAPCARRLRIRSRSRSLGVGR